MTNRFLTTGELAIRLGVQVHKVEYLIRSRRVESAGRAGNAHVYSLEQLEFLRAELSRIDEKRSHRGTPIAPIAEVAGAAA